MNSLSLLLMTRTLGVLAVSGLLAAQAAPRPAGEDLHLHGHWIVEVRNPDGSLAARREFDNALVDPGKGLLAGLLGGGQIAQWNVQLFDEFGNSPCYTSGHANRCFIVDPTPPFSDSSFEFYNLARQLPRDSAPPNAPIGTLQLSGWARVTNPAPTSVFDLVTTNIRMSLADQSLAAGVLTSHNFTPVTVTPNQIINVIVRFSFS